MIYLPPQRIDKGLVKPEADLSRFTNVKKASEPVTKKGRDPINSREEILQKTATITGTKIPRWCRYSEAELTRGLARLAESVGVKNKSGYLIWLLCNP